MKKLLSIGFAVIILLGLILLTVSAAEATPAYKESRVVLSEDISLRFVFKGLTKGAKYTVNLASSEGEKNVSITADSNGEAYAVYDALTPAMLDLDITATLVGTDVAPVTRSVMDYCEWALSTMALSNEVHTLVVDLLNYAAAAQTYLNPESPSAAELNAVQQNLTSAVPVKIKNYLKTGDQTDKPLQWTGAGPVLGESVAYRFRFAADEATLEGLKFTATMDGRSFEIKGYKKDESGYYVDFATLTPADLLHDVVIVAKNANGEEISITKTISLDRYTSWVRSDTTIPNHDELCALLNATLAYSRGAKTYVDNGINYSSEVAIRDLSAAPLTAAEKYRLSCISIENYDGAAYNGKFAEAMYNKAGLSVSGLNLSSSTTVATIYNNRNDYSSVLVSGTVGGTSSGKYPFLAQSEFEIGDLLYARVPVDGENSEKTSSYWTALYLGNGNFLLETSNEADMEISYTKLKSYLLDGNQEISDANSDPADDQVATVDKALYYYVLRPNQAAREAQGTFKNTVTRGEMEDALKATLWAYYAKGPWAQYESGTFNAISYTHGGYSPLGSHMDTLEDANAQNTLYSVCSNYAWCAYYEALGYPLYGYCLNPGSAYVWIMADQVPVDAEGDSLCIMRWHNYPCDDKPTSDYWDYDDEDKNSTAIAHDPEVCLGYGNGADYSQKTAHNELVTFFTNYEQNLRPGDIIRLPGHVVVYAGDGWILEAGGGKYDKTYGYDSKESDGVINATRIEDYFLNNSNASFYLGKFNSGRYGTSWAVNERNLAGICVLRPLNQMTTGHNADPADDVLDLNYYNFGTVSLPWQLEQDTVELSHTGYNIQPSTYTRMLYPMLNINRTVNVGAYGTAVKGGTITYSVEIINQSNDAKYITTRGTDYAGETYMCVPITETIPANVEFVSASEGYTLKDGVLSWKIDVPAGESVSVTYTVRVTGDIGDEIVNGGGFVGAIPSNTIVNTIGGQNLSETVINNLLAFYEAGKSSWNSNDGYHISASINQDGSVFAEQIYNAVGLELDLPELEELLEILFSREYISISKGTFVGWNKSASSWMLTLNDETADPNDQVWRNMVINGSYFGGKYVWTNNLDEDTRRVSIPRTDNLMPGDFIICMDISNAAYEAYAYKIPDWKVIFYLGDDKYASLTSNGVLTACDGPRELIGSIVWDVFIGMRPSQAYENVNEALYNGTPASLTAADAAWQANGPSSVALSSSFMNTIKGFSDTTKVPYVNSLGENATRSFDTGVPMIGDVYALAGLDVNTNGLSGMTYKNLMFMLFNDLPSDSEVYATYSHEYHRLEQAVYGYENINNMLMYYDGQAYVDKNPLTDIADLKVGDAIVLGRQSGKIQQVMIYQGDGKFLMSTESPIGGFYLGSWLETKTFADLDALLAYLNGYIVNKSGAVVRDGKYWEGYLVLRPSRGFANINTHVVRDLAEHLLTEEELTVLSRLPATELASVNYNTFIRWAYGQAMIDVGDRFAIKDGEGAVSNNLYYYQVFDDSCLLKTTDSDFTKMLVDKSWGGTKFDEKKQTSYQLPLEDFQVGDIIIGRYQSGGSNYRAAIYLGNNRFLVKFTNYARIIVCESEADIYGAQNWYYYFVLRPERVGPRDLPDKLLTDEEKQALASLTGATMSDSSFNTFVRWAYMQAGIDTSRYFDYPADKNYFYGSFTESNKIAELISDTSRPGVKMLVPNSWRGSYFTSSELGEHTLAFADYEIGDVVVGRYPGESGNVYKIAIYQGSNTFLVKSGKTVTVETYESEEEICGNNAWQYFFVLRPQNLAEVDVPDPEPEEPAPDVVIDKIQLPPIQA